MEFHLPLIAKNAVYFFSKILHRTLGTLCVLSKIVLQRSLKQLPYWLATLSADSAISICCRSKITVTVQRLWQASSRKTNLSYPLRQPVIYTTTSEKRTPWSRVSFGRKMSACITFHLFLRPTISRRLFKTVSTFCNMKSPILWNAPSASFFSWQGISPSMTQTSEPLR